MIPEHFISGPYTRVFVAHAEIDDFVSHYLRNFGGRLEYEFDISRLGNLKVVGIESPNGNVSAVATDAVDELPDYVQRTNLLYRVKDIRATLDACRASGIEVLQEATPVTVGFRDASRSPAAMSSRWPN
jgi:predicted enzyme related to lactoylglutathione lyase